MITGEENVDVGKMRLSLLWHQSLMADERARERPPVLDSHRYRALFTGSQGASGGSLSLPWPSYGSQGFWELYLGRPQALVKVKGRDAWRALVPLRRAAPLKLSTPYEGVTIATEGLLHPWGVTFVVTFTINCTATFESAAQLLLALRKDRCLDSRAGEGANPSQVSLDEATVEGLQKLREEAVGGTPRGMEEPFSVFTLAQADGPGQSFEPAAEGVKRFLHAVTSFSPTWDRDKLPDLTEATVAGRSYAPPSHLVYGRRRARAIWSPENFRYAGTSPGRPSTLSCHHRNLVMASSQTEALGHFAADTASRLTSGLELSSDHRDQARWAVGILQRLYDGSRETYRSGSMKAHLGENKWLDSINVIRADVDLPPLAA